MSYINIIVKLCQYLELLWNELIELIGEDFLCKDQISTDVDLETCLSYYKDLGMNEKDNPFKYHIKP